MAEYNTHHIFLIPSRLVVFISANPSQLSKWRYLGDILKSLPILYFLNILLKSRKLFFVELIYFFLIEYLFSKVNIMILSNLHISSSALQTPIWISLKYFCSTLVKAGHHDTISSNSPFLNLCDSQAIVRINQPIHTQTNTVYDSSKQYTPIMQ